MEDKGAEKKSKKEECKGDPWLRIVIFIDTKDIELEMLARRFQVRLKNTYQTICS